MNVRTRVIHLLGLMATLLASGCCDGPKNYRWTEDQRLVPEEFTKAVVPLGQEKALYKLDYNALYVVEPTTRSPLRMWFRFWPNGRVLGKATFEGRNDGAIPTAANAEDFRRSISAFYSIVGDRITIEYIGQTESILLCTVGYRRLVGRVRVDGSFTLAEGSSALPSIYVEPREHEVYRPMPVAGMRRQPDW